MYKSLLYGNFSEINLLLNFKAFLCIKPTLFYILTKSRSSLSRTNFFYILRFPKFKNLHSFLNIAKITWDIYNHLTSDIKTPNCSLSVHRVLVTNCKIACSTKLGTIVNIEMKVNVYALRRSTVSAGYGLRGYLLQASLWYFVYVLHLALSYIFY